MRPALRLRNGVYLVAAPDGGAILDTRLRAGRAGCLAISAPGGQYLDRRLHGAENHRRAAAVVAHSYGVDVDQVDADMARLLKELWGRRLLSEHVPGRRRLWRGWWR
ncbi:hypothetical protein [Streptomyces violaceusniger]|uniref:PqqD family protein n=1 Tax=Streptomyces violaceusniger (strain Tu 4113) TaxID=653045 RepID=G2PH78_STRV4|nr:hypothetical protein [Streptomyces violaceusniger]AEM88724.1 hypothetical protein Strvi_9473 [Streptomyces violaceusniger Tu 4113]